MRFRAEDNSYLPKRLHKKGAAFYFVQQTNGRPHWISLGTDFDFVISKWKELTSAIDPEFDYSNINFDLIRKHRTKRFSDIDFDKNIERTYKKAKRSAITRGIDFYITLQDLINLYAEANGKCQLTGISFSYEVIEGRSSRPWIPTLDRVDSTKPYTIDNCRIVCHSVNMALNQFGDEILIKIAKNLLKINDDLESSLSYNAK